MLLCIENTHNYTGGGAVTPAQVNAAAGAAHAAGMRVHCDGARLFNAAVALGVPAAELVEQVDSVMFCVSKGLSAPVGSILCGEAAFIDAARDTRKIHGGSMRQAGVIAAAGILSLEEMVDRLAEDHAASRGIDQIPVHGPYSVSVPGAVDGWAVLLDRYGAMPLAEVLKAPIEYAENGFPVSEIIAANWADRAEPIAERKDFREAYLPGGRAPRHGEVFRNPGLAWTYRQIAEGGRDAFYRGEIARRIVEHLDREGWPVSMDDLDSQRSDWVEPISTSYRQYELHELPPNGQGMAALEMLNILEGYDLRSLGHNSAAYLHLLLEAKKLAFADLDAWLADPERAELPVDTIISKDYAAGQRKRIRREKAAAAVESGISAADRNLISSGDTVYLTVVDRDRNMVSFINSLFHGFGSGVTVPGTGIVLQNRGALFSLERGHPNRIEPRKRPYHTIIPAMACHGGKPWMSFGVMGGDMQPQGHVQIMLNRIEFGMNVQEAGEAARIKHNPLAGVAVESGIPAAAVADLDRRGHDIVRTPGVFGGYQAIEVDWDQDVLIGGTDPRKDGLVAAW